MRANKSNNLNQRDQAMPNNDYQRSSPRLLWVLVGIALGVVLLVAVIAVYGYVTGTPWVGMIEYTYDANGRVTASDGYKTFWDWLGLLIVPLVLAIGGSLIAVFITRSLETQRERTAWSTRIAEEYLRRYDQHAAVRAVLNKKEADLKDADWATLFAWGDWLEFVAMLSNLDMTDRDLMREMGIDSFICEFYTTTHQWNKLAGTWREHWQHIVRFCRPATGGT
jgi:hypothetical protein